MEYPHTRRIFRSNYPLSSRLWNSMMEELQIIFCRFFGNKINNVQITKGELSTVEEDMESKFESYDASLSALSSSYLGLMKNIANSRK